MVPFRAVKWLLSNIKDVTMTATLKFFKQYLLANHLFEWPQTLWEPLGQRGDSEVMKVTGKCGRYILHAVTVMGAVDSYISTLRQLWGKLVITFSTLWGLWGQLIVTFFMQWQLWGQLAVIFSTLWGSLHSLQCDCYGGVRYYILYVVRAMGKLVITFSTLWELHGLLFITFSTLWGLCSTLFGLCGSLLIHSSHKGCWALHSLRC